MKQFGNIAITFVISVVLLLSTAFPAHAAANLSLSPGSANVPQGSAVTLAINVNTGGEAVNAVEVILNFPSDKLKATRISHSGSAFGINAESVVSGGVVKIAKGKLPPAVVGFRRVASVTFTALSQGQATVTVSGQSKVLRESDSGNILSGPTGATLTITPPSATPPPSQTSPNTQEDKTVEPIKISSVEVLNLGIQTATISWKTNKPADSQVEYGFVTSRANDPVNYFFNAQNADLTTDHQIQLDAATLIPGHLYHFRLLSKDTNGNETSTEDATFLMPGYPLTATVTDINNKPVEGAKVQLSSLELEATTDKNGQAFFQDLPVSTLPVIVNYKGKIKQSSVSTLADQNALAIVLDQKVSSFNYLWVAVVILLLALTIVIYIFRRRHFFSKQHFRPPPPV